jgi:hypoxanthine phosphoribosyltransferase
MSQILIRREAIDQRVKELGAAISRDYAGQDLVVVAVLKGAAIFASDLIRSITLPLRLEFIEVRSYVGTRTTAQVDIVQDLRSPLAGHHVLLVEDIVDTGLTLSRLLDRLAAEQPKSLRTCVLLDKPSRRLAPVPIDYLGFSIPDHFVVGYGLDYQGYHRNLPEVRAWQEE